MSLVPLHVDDKMRFQFQMKITVITTAHNIIEMHDDSRAMVVIQTTALLILIEQT